MARKFLTALDLAKNELQNAKLQNLAADPSSPVLGQTYFNTGSNKIRTYNGSTWDEYGTGGGSGTVTSVSVASANGFAGSVATATSTPAITLTTSITGLLKGNGTAISAATSGTDYVTGSSANTLTNKTFDAQGTGNALSNVATSMFASNVVDTDTGLAANSDTRLASQKAVKAYVDNVAQGLDPKPGTRVATAAALPACTYSNGTSGVGATLTENANGSLTVDGYAVVAGDIVLVKNQATGAQNGLYDVTQAGDGSTPFILTRNPYMDTTAEFQSAYIVVEDAGSTNANSFWVCTNSANPTVGTTAITFSQMNGATQLTAGTGISISGNTVSSAWRTTFKYTATIGDGSTTAIAVTHSLGVQDVLAQVRDASTNAVVECDITQTSTTVTTFTFAVAPASNAYKVVIIG